MALVDSYHTTSAVVCTITLHQGKSHLVRCGKKLLAAVSLLVWGLGASASTVSDSLQFRVLFPINSSEVQTDILGNKAVLSEFISALNELKQDEQVTDIHLTIRGNASIDGDVDSNMILAKKRALSLSSLLVTGYSIDGSLIEVQEQPLSVEAETILSGFPENLPGIDLPSIRKISRSEAGSRIKQAIIELDGGKEGANWNWYKQNILNPSRFAEIMLSFERTKREPEIVGPVPAPLYYSEEKPEEKVEVVPPPSETDGAETAVEFEPEPLKSGFRIGTNLLYDVATVANLYLECDFSRHAAINLLATFSPWDIRTPDLKIRTFILQPEFRWYFADNFKGHHIGVEGYFGWYDVALGGRTRYQDKDGNTPLWGAGLSYGYVLPFSEHWGMDFSIGAGYACLVYDCFYNVENGARYTTITRNWWGPTKLGISIYYQF